MLFTPMLISILVPSLLFFKIVHFLINILSKKLNGQFPDLIIILLTHGIFK